MTAVAAFLFLLLALILRLPKIRQSTVAAAPRASPSGLPAVTPTATPTHADSLRAAALPMPQQHDRGKAVRLLAR